MYISPTTKQNVPASKFHHYSVWSIKLLGYTSSLPIPFKSTNKKLIECQAVTGSRNLQKLSKELPPHPKPTHPTSAKESERLRPEGDVFTSWRLKMAGKSSLKTGPLWLHDSDLRLIWTNHTYQLYKRGHKRYLPSETHFPCCELTEIGIPKKDLKSTDQNQKN